MVAFIAIFELGPAITVTAWNRVGRERGRGKLVSYLVRVGLLTAIYFAAAKLGLSLAVMHPNVSLVWPPTGIALAALLLFGYRLWPGIALGAFLINASTGVGLATAAGIGVGNTLEALAGAYLLRRFAHFRNSLERIQDVLGLVTLAAGLSTTVSATIGVTSLCLGGAAPWALYGSLWWQWWLGDAMGALVVAPALLTWATRSQLSWRPRKIAEAGGLLVLLVTVSQIVFGGWLTTDTTNSPLKFAVFPFLIWAALRFGQREAATMTLVLSGIVTWDTVRDLGPFAGATLTESMLVSQTFMSVVAVTALVLAASITQRRRVDEALHTSERRLAAALDIAEAAVISVDETQRVIWFDQGAEKIFGYTAQELLGQSLDLLLPSRFTDVHRQHIRDFGVGTVAARRMGERREVFGRRKDGTEFPAEAAISKLNLAGQSTFTAVLRDITERKREEQRRVLANRELEMLLQVISHDLKEPLRAIENFSSIVHERYAAHLDEKGQDLVQRTVKATARMRLLLDSIMALSMARRMIHPTEEVQGEALVREALEQLKGTIEKTGVKIAVAPGIPRLRVDRTWATQAIYNLLSNALKFTREGEAPDVEIAPYQPTRKDPRGVGIVVRDRGPGVPPDHAERIFELFQRAVGREVEGTGAGLAIVREVARRHGGDAWVRPRAGGGSEFVITFGTGKPSEGMP